MANDTHLKVIKGGNNKSPGTTTWAEGVRNDAKSLAGKLDEGYMELARLLYAIWDTPIDGDKKNAPVYTQWGYVSFAEYVEQELGIHRKKAQRLRAIWYNLEVQLGDNLPPELKARIVALGFSKVRELASVLTVRNAESWTTKAEELSYPKLCIAIRQYRDDLKEYQAKKAVEEAANPTVIDEEGNPVESSGGGDGPEPVDSVIGEPVEFGEPQVPDFKSEQFKAFNLSLSAEQYLIVKDAVDAAGKLSNSDKKSHNVHLICLEFLANNGDGKGNVQSKMQKLVSIAEILGLDLVIVDEGDVVYGLNTLEKLAENS